MEELLLSAGSSPDLGPDVLLVTFQRTIDADQVSATVVAQGDLQLGDHYRIIAINILAAAVGMVHTNQEVRYLDYLTPVIAERNEFHCLIIKTSHQDKTPVSKIQSHFDLLFI